MTVKIVTIPVTRPTMTGDMFARFSRARIIGSMAKGCIFGTEGEVWTFLLGKLDWTKVASLVRCDKVLARSSGESLY